MKSVLCTIIMFIAIYVILYNDVLGFFAQRSVFIFAICAVLFMLIVAFLVLGIPKFNLKGGHHEKDDNLPD